MTHAAAEIGLQADEMRISPRASWRRKNRRQHQAPGLFCLGRSVICSIRPEANNPPRYGRTSAVVGAGRKCRMEVTGVPCARARYTLFLRNRSHIETDIDAAGASSSN